MAVAASDSGVVGRKGEIKWSQTCTVSCVAYSGRVSGVLTVSQQQASAPSALTSVPGFDADRRTPEDANFP